MKIPFRWLDVIGNTKRAKVFGGWLVYRWEFDEEVGTSETMVFIPDPNHEWEIE